MPATSIEAGEAVGLKELLRARLASLDFDARKDAFKPRFYGLAPPATSRDGTSIKDYRLTLSDTFRYSPRWQLIGVAASWLVATTEGGYRRGGGGLACRQSA